MKQLDLLQRILSNRLEIRDIPVNEELEISIIMYILSHFNLRICEILRLTNSDVMQPSTIRVRIAKSKQTYIINDDYLCFLIAQLKRSLEQPLFTISYSRLYRYILLHYPSAVLRGISKNRKVTHSFRYVNAKKVNDYFKDVATTRTQLHHSSNSAQSYYLRNPKLKGKK